MIVKSYGKHLLSEILKVPIKGDIVVAHFLRRLEGI